MQNILSRAVFDDSTLAVKPLPRYFGAYLTIAAILDFGAIAYFLIVR